MSKGIIEVAVDVKAKTDKAYLVTDGTVEEWIPRSMIEDECEENGEISSIFIPEWLAQKKGLI